MYSPSTSQHTCTASLVLSNIRQYLDIIERDMRGADPDPERLQQFAVQLQHDATTLADQTRLMNGEGDRNA